MLKQKSNKVNYIVSSLVLLLILSASMVYAKNGITLRKVDHINVCMTNNKDMGKEQLPIKVEGKTYYGCCKMCVGNLTNNAEARHAVDPVSGNKVDKALAFLGALPNGNILYFENEENFNSYTESN